MKVLDAIKKGFEVAGKNFNLVLVVFVFNVIWNWVAIPFMPDLTKGQQVKMPPAFMVISLFFILVSIFIQGGILGSVRDVLKEGKAELGRFAGYGAKFYLRLFLIALVMILIILIGVFFATLIIGLSAPAKNTAVVILAAMLTLAVILGMIYTVVLLAFSPYISVIEDTGVFQAFSMSVAFVKQILFKVIGLGLLLSLISFGFGFLMGVINGVLSFAIKGKILQWIMAVLNGGVNAYLVVLIAGCLVAYYLGVKSNQTDKESASPEVQT